MSICCCSSSPLTHAKPACLYSQCAAMPPWFLCCDRALEMRQLKTLRSTDFIPQHSLHVRGMGTHHQHLARGPPSISTRHTRLGGEKLLVSQETQEIMLWRVPTTESWAPNHFPLRPPCSWTVCVLLNKIFIPSSLDFPLTEQHPQ